MMLIYYKTWIYQCLIKQVKSPSICSRIPETGSDPPIGSYREPGCDMKSIPQQSKISMIKIGVRGIMFRFVTAPNCWHRAQVLQNLKQSLNSVGQ